MLDDTKVMECCSFRDMMSENHQRVALSKGGPLPSTKASCPRQLKRFGVRGSNRLGSLKAALQGWQARERGGLFRPVLFLSLFRNLRSRSASGPDALLV